jgi:DNA repair exonuclease SbcCD ATPase subunit
MDLDFDLLDIEGFRTFIGREVLDFHAIGPGLHFMEGRNLAKPSLESNGAGKSSIWGALVWCLYGKTVGGLNRNDVKPWECYGKIPTYVELHIFCDHKKHRILRTLSKLTLDGKIVPQERIDALIGMSFAVFTHTILLGQGQHLFFDLFPSKKLELFTPILKLDRWDNYSKTAGDEAKGIASDITAANAKLDALDEEKRRLNLDRGRLDDQSEDWEQERRERNKKSNTDLTKLEKELKHAEDRHAEASLKVDGAGAEIKGLITEITRGEKLLAASEKQLLKFNSDMERKRERANELDDELGKLGKGDKCPTCGQSTKGTALAKHRADLERRISALDDESQAKPPKKLVEDIAKLTKTLKIAEDARARFEAVIDRWQAGVDFTAPQIAGLKAQINAAKEAKREREEESNPYLEQRRSLDKRARQIAKEIGRLQDQLISLESRKTQTAFWVKGFKEVKLYEIEECLHELEIATNSMLDEFGLIDWAVRYDIERETKSNTTQRGLNVMILSPENDKAVKWEAWSGGEGQRLRICGALALGEVLLHYAGIEPSLEILDEPTQAVSRRGIDDLCEFLAERAQRLDRQIFLTDQHVIQSPAFSSTITVTREKKYGSRIDTKS